MVKLTKNELRDQQYKLKQLQKYLPTLQLKKAMLQTEVSNASYEIEQLTGVYLEEKSRCETFEKLLSHSDSNVLFKGTHVSEVEKRYENVAGAEIPYFENVLFSPFEYSLMDTSLWMDSAMEKIKILIKAKAQVNVVQEKKKILEKELREVSIRVNLFEKILIPRTQSHIKKIKIFLGDQELASVAQAKVAKAKILKKKEGA